MAAGRERADVLLRCSRECAQSDAVADAIAEAEEALGIWRVVADRLREGETMAWLARLSWTSNRIGEADELGRSAVAQLSCLPPSIELARAQATVGQLLCQHYAHPEAEDWVRRALQLAEELGAEDVAAQVSIDLGTLMAVRGDPTGRSRVEQAIERARSIGANEVAAFGMFNLVRISTIASRHDQVRVAAARAKAFCADHRFAIWEAYVRAVEAQDLLHQGRWSEAETMATALWHSTSADSPTSRAAIVCTTLGLLRRRRGKPDPDRLLHVAGERLEGAPITGPVLELAAARAECAWMDGGLDMLVPELRGLWQIARVREGWWVDELRWWLTVAEGNGAREWRATAQRWTERKQPYQRALALTESGEEAPLREALAITHELGAQPLGRLVAGRLRALGVRSRPRANPTRTRTGPLSAREHEVLALLADGLRDVEIAEQLHLSERTVNHHVSAVLQKLTAPSRTAAVARAFREGLLTGK
jgi:DNA-binding CsgD family transcriptional regulator